MYDKPAHMEPLLPATTTALEDMALEVLDCSATLGGQLLDEGLLVANTPKGPVRLAMPTFVAGYLFPDLYPAQIQG